MSINNGSRLCIANFIRARSVMKRADRRILSRGFVLNAHRPSSIQHPLVVRQLTL